MTTEVSTPRVNRRAFLAGAAAAAGSTVAVGCAQVAPRKEPPPAAHDVRWGFLVDLRKCVGCRACAVACKTEFDVRLGVFRSSVKEYETGDYPNARRMFVPWLCNHCQKPACLANCPVDPIEASFRFPDGREVKYMKRATYQRPDGLVLIDQDRCIGCGECVLACPYEVRYMDPVKEKADKCTLCVHRLEQGLVPSCVNTCQGNARVVGDLNDPGSEISRLVRTEKVQVLKPEEGTNPQCYYIGLDPDAYEEGRDVK